MKRGRSEEDDWAPSGEEDGFRQYTPSLSERVKRRRTKVINIDSDSDGYSGPENNVDYRDRRRRSSSPDGNILFKT